jgi:hypothetical protein
MKRKHAELIKKWADGADIQVWNANLDVWKYQAYPAFFDYYEYREEPKPDVVYYANFRKNLVSAYHIEKFKDDNLRLTFCAETGELKSAEVL